LEKVQIQDFFDVYNPVHLKAYHILQTTGAWPENFVPKNVERSPGWHVALLAKFTNEWMKCALNERWPTEIELDISDY
jgi:hypothetical protein